MGLNLRLQLLCWLKGINNTLSKFWYYRSIAFQKKFQNERKKYISQKQKTKKEVQELQKKYNSLEHVFYEFDQHVGSAKYILLDRKDLLEQGVEFRTKSRKTKGRKRDTEQKKIPFFEKEINFFAESMLNDINRDLRDVLRSKKGELKEQKSFIRDYCSPKYAHILEGIRNNDAREDILDQAKGSQVFVEEVCWKYLQNQPEGTNFERFSQKTRRTLVKSLRKNKRKKNFDKLYALSLEKIKKLELAKTFSMQKELALRWIPKDTKVNKASISKALKWVYERAEREKVYQSLNHALELVDFYDFFSWEAFEVLDESLCLIQLLDRPKLTSEILLLAILRGPELESTLRPIINRKKAIKLISQMPAYLEDQKVKPNFVEQAKIVIEETKKLEQVKEKTKEVKKIAEKIREKISRTKENILKAKEELTKENILKVKKELTKENVFNFLDRLKNKVVLKTTSLFNRLSSAQIERKALVKKFKYYLRFIDSKLNQFDDITLDFLDDLDFFWENLRPILIKQDFLLGEFENEKIDFAPELEKIFETLLKSTSKFKTPIMTTEMLLLAIMENPTSNAGKILCHLIPSKTNWLMLRFRLLKRIREEQIAIGALKEMRYFGILLQREINDYQLHRLIEVGCLDIATQIFREETIGFVMDSDIQRREEDILLEVALDLDLETKAPSLSLQEQLKQFEKQSE